MPNTPNTLYYGDNLDILRRYIKDESVDLVYLDPPFNSNADYNVLFAEHADAKGTTEKSHAQIQAFKDTWTWDIQAAQDFTDAVKNGGPHVANCMMAFRTLLGTSDMLAYLAMMAPRLLELRRALKPTGSIYLHCDPTASHYLKLLMDAVFGPQNFLNEVIWKRTSAHSAARRWNVGHDVILVCAKSNQYTWNNVLTPYSEEYTARYRRKDDEGKPWTDDNLTAPGVRHGDSGALWRNFDPTSRGLHWKVNLKTVVDLVGEEKASQLSTTEKLDLLDKNGFILWSVKKAGGTAGFPRFKRFLGAGQAIQDVISDIPPINSQAQERLGYPTQKPEALLERILQASSNQGDTVLDPFCGCGTTIAAAQKLNRRWIGIDITHLAVNLIKVRLADSFGKKIASTYKVVGEPEDLESAKALAEADKYQFQYWALGLIGARPAASQEKKGADKGIDGRLYITDASGDVKSIIISVKGGHVSVPQLRDLRGVVERENAAIGVFISLEEFTKPMRQEAADAGFYENKTDVGQSQHPRLQLLTIEDLLSGKRLDLPLQQDLRSFKQAPKARKKASSEDVLF